jgi:uncharacterized HAD superfamily protein
MKIGIDLDEVLGYFLPTLIEFHNSTYKTDLKINNFHSYDFWDIWGGNREEAIQKVFEFYRSDFFKNIKIIDGSEEAIKKLKKDNELFIITSRPKEIREETFIWIENNFPNVFSEIYFTSDFSKDINLKTKKGVCDDLNIDILIEDSGDYANNCVSSKRKVFLFNYPWNKNIQTKKGVIRINSWEEILKEIFTLKKDPTS